MPTPIIVEAFDCAYGCGCFPSMDEARMRQHESTCFGNPARRACKTCRHKGPKSRPCAVDPSVQRATFEFNKWEGR
jgi:hypothetical protein